MAATKRGPLVRHIPIMLEGAGQPRLGAGQEAGQREMMVQVPIRLTKESRTDRASSSSTESDNSVEGGARSRAAGGAGRLSRPSGEYRVVPVGKSVCPSCPVHGAGTGRELQAPALIRATRSRPGPAPPPRDRPRPKVDIADWNTRQSRGQQGRPAQDKGRDRDHGRGRVEESGRGRGNIAETPATAARPGCGILKTPGKRKVSSNNRVEFLDNLQEREIPGRGAV